MRTTLAVLLALVVFGCAGLRMPVAPAADKLVRDEPIFCADWVLYLHVYDTNPETKAAVAVIGPTSAQHTHGTPIMVVEIDDAGRVSAVYVSVAGAPAEKLTPEQFEARFGSDACRVAASTKA